VGLGAGRPCRSVGAEIPFVDGCRRCEVQGTGSMKHGARSRVRRTCRMRKWVQQGMTVVALVWWDGGAFGCATQGVLSRLPWLIT